MSLSIGITGLPNVGKSTLFKALTKKEVDISNYPFCTIESNTGVVEVPDERLQELARIFNVSKIIPAVIKFIDIAGLVKNAHKGEGLGNQFLSHIRECDAILEVVRNFEDPNISHVEGKINPSSDMETIKIELALADLNTLEKRLGKLKKEVKTNPKLKNEVEILEKIKKFLEEEKQIRDLNLDDKEKELIKDLNLLTAKPHIYVFNVGEDQLKSFDPSPYLSRAKSRDNLEPNISLPISAKLESELLDLDENETKEYLAELGQRESGLNKLIKVSYKLLDLITFFTSNFKEVRAWTVKNNAKAPQAAGVIHTDFEKGFISTDVINYDELIKFSTYYEAKEKGKIRTEGKDYIVQDGDVMLFKANV